MIEHWQSWIGLIFKHPLQLLILLVRDIITRPYAIIIIIIIIDVVVHLYNPGLAAGADVLKGDVAEAFPAL